MEASTKLITRAPIQAVYCETCNEHYRSINQAAYQHGTNQGNVSHHLQGTRDHVDGHVMRRAEKYVPAKHVDFNGEAIEVGDHVISARNGGAFLNEVLELTHGKDGKPNLKVRNLAKGTEHNLFNLRTTVMVVDSAFGTGDGWND